MTHAAHVPADFVSTFRHRFAPLFGRKIGRQRSEQYLGGLLGGRAERRNVTSLAGTVDGATARALGWLLNKSPWQTRPVVDALQTYVGDTFGAPEGLFTLNLDSFVKRGDNAVGVEKQYVHHLGRTQNCQIGVFLAYGTEQHSALVDAALYMPHSWIDGAARRAKAGVPESVQYQPKSALAIELLRVARGRPPAGHLGDHLARRGVRAGPAGAPGRRFLAVLAADLPGSPGVRQRGRRRSPPDRRSPAGRRLDGPPRLGG